MFLKMGSHTSLKNILLQTACFIPMLIISDCPKNAKNCFSHTPSCMCLTSRPVTSFPDYQDLFQRILSCLYQLVCIASRMIFELIVYGSSVVTS